MRPVIAKLLERDGKTYMLPIPPRLNDLKECARVLEIETMKDEEDISFLGYRSLIGVAPAEGDRFCVLGDTEAYLSMLTREQLDAVRKLCAAFGLTYENIAHFFDFIRLAKNLSRDELMKKGVPANKSGEGTE